MSGFFVRVVVPLEGSGSIDIDLECIHVVIDNMMRALSARVMPGLPAKLFVNSDYQFLIFAEIKLLMTIWLVEC